MTTIGERIYAARSKKGYPQTWLANKIDVSQAQISQWENNRAVPSQRYMVKLEKVLGPLQAMKTQRKGTKSEQLAFLAEAGVGQKIKSIRFFNPHDRKQISKVPDTPGVYLLYAGGNNLAVDHAFKSNEPINLDKIKMVGTPEYIGKANKLRTRIRQHGPPRGDWWWREDWIDLAICIEVDGRGKLHDELETLLIKLLSPQVNVRKQGVGLP